MDPLPPPTTASNRALELRRRSSKSRSSTSSRVGSRSTSAVPDVQEERIAPRIATNADEPNVETHQPLGSPRRSASRERIVVPREEVDAAGTIPASRSPEVEELEQRPRKRRRLSSVGTAAGDPPSSSLTGPGTPGPSLQLSARSPSYPQMAPSSRLEDGPIDVDALPDSPIFIPSSSPVPSPVNNPSGSKPNRASMGSRDSSLFPSSPTTAPISLPSRSGPEPLNTYVCPICFSTPTNATMTPCGHVCCGECLFSAVKSTIERSAYHGPASQRARCPVCRAPIPQWDGRGRGVIGLKPRVAYNIENSR